MAGFDRLNRGKYEEAKIDKRQYDYVPHYIFIFATRTSQDHVKEAVRALRRELIATTHEMGSAFLRLVRRSSSLHSSASSRAGAPTFDPTK